MNNPRKLYCRVFQTVFKIALPFLPYRKPKIISKIREEDIPALSHYADKEANPLYPVPVLTDARELAVFYRMIMEKQKGALSHE